MSGGLRRRLKRLEEIIRVEAPSFADQFFVVHQIALAKLSAADRDLLQRGTTLMGDKSTETHKAAWTRWEAAHAAAVRETECRFYIAASDWWL